MACDLREHVWPALRADMSQWQLDLHLREIELDSPDEDSLRGELRRLGPCQSTWVLILACGDTASGTATIADLLTDLPQSSDVPRRFWWIDCPPRQSDLCKSLREAGEHIHLRSGAPDPAGRLHEIERFIHDEVGGAMRRWVRETAPELVRGASEPPAEDTPLQLEVFHPCEVPPDHTRHLIAYIHEASALDDVAIDAGNRLRVQGRTGGGIRGSLIESVAAIDRNLPVTVVPTAQGVEFVPRANEITLWPGDRWQSAQFSFRVRADMVGRGCDGTVTFLQGPLVCGAIDVNIYCTHEPSATRAQAMSRHLTSPYRSVFVSYSHEDVEVVEICECYAEAIGDRYLRDVRMLRAGEAWSEKLLEAIDQVDMFQLFWSPRAAASCYVKAEWKHALNRQQQEYGFIRPVYWEAPLNPEPPSQLAGLHFVQLDLERLRSGIPR